MTEIQTCALPIFSLKLKENILVTSKSSRFCKFLKKDLKKFNAIFTTKKNFNLLNFKQMEKFVKNKKIKYLIHVAGLSRPMDIQIGRASWRERV